MPNQDYCNCAMGFKFNDECSICGAQWEKKGMIDLTFKTLCCRKDVSLKQIIKSVKYTEATVRIAQRIIDARDRVKINSDVIDALVESILVMSSSTCNESAFYAEAAIERCRSVLESLGADEDGEDS